MRRIAIIGLCSMFLLVASGCFSLNWAHNRRHVKKVFDQLSQLHEDIDRVVFGLERNPAE